MRAATYGPHTLSREPLSPCLPRICPRTMASAVLAAIAQPLAAIAQPQELPPPPCGRPLPNMGLPQVYYDWERARPHGCFYHESADYLGDTVYFNPYEGGDRFGDDMRVCRLSPPPPPPQPPSPPAPPLPPSPPPVQGPRMCLSDFHADGVSARTDGNAVAGLSVWVWGSKTYPAPDGALAGQTAATSSSPPSWGDSSICVYFSPVMDQCFEIRDSADNTILNSVCTRMMPQEVPQGALIYKTFWRLELSGGASLAFFYAPNP